MKNLKVPFLAGLVVLFAAGTWGARTLNAQQPGFKRVELERHDLGNPGHEAVLARGEFNAGAGAPKHTHPGEEVGYVLEGQVVLEVEGKPPATMQAGDVFFIPAGTVHSARNAGANPAKVLSTYIVEKGKPLATPVK
jgi:quercetin dioxygenase-like cupin family protein